MEFKDRLEVEGINSIGYGILPKMVVLDNRLTIEAKAIYSYFCAYAGAGTQAFPSVKKIMGDLNIGKGRYYKHFNLLLQYGYITTRQVRNSKGFYKHNVYTLNTNPVEKEMEKEEKKENKIENNPNVKNDETDKRSIKNRHTENWASENEDNIINNNSFIINNSLYNYQSIKKKSDGWIESKNSLEEIFKKADINNIYLKEDYLPVRRSIELLYNRTTPLVTNNAKIDPETIRSNLALLEWEHVENGLNIYKKQSREIEIKNKLSYLGVCIYNSIFQNNLDTEDRLRLNGYL